MSQLADALTVLAAKALLAAYCEDHKERAPISCGALLPILLVQIVEQMERVVAVVEEYQRAQGGGESRPLTGAGAGEGRVAEGDSGGTQPGQ